MGPRLPRGASIGGMLAVLSACGGQGTDLNQVTGDDGGTAAQGSDPPPTQYQDPFAGTPPYAAGQGGDNSHNAGKSCMDHGCHGTLSGHSDAPAFLIGGTVYQDYKGQTPAAGVEVRIVDSAGHAASTYSGREGNFYIRAGSANGVTFPAIVGARDATTTRPMITTLSADTMGSCGQSSCHVPAGSPASGAYYPIHVP